MTRRVQGGEAGFAMLVVFLLAACIGIALYMELPRVVMESQRDREELLIDRGTQYQRAIQVYYRKFSRYPTDLDALENTNNVRFLRRRFKDPMTGEDNWRLIHIAGPGIFTDSLVYAPPGTKPAQSASTSTGSEEETPTPVWMQQRPSDRILAGVGGTEQPMPGMAGTPSEQVANSAGAPAAGTVVTSMVPGGNPEESPASIQAAPGQTGVEPGSPAGAVSTLPSPVPTGPPPPGTIAAPQFGNQPPIPIVPGMTAVAPGQVGAANPATVTAVGGSQAAQPANAAIPMIQQLLTSPNPRGIATAFQSATGQQSLQPGGIGGVASKLESGSIKVYNDRSKYNEWEFIYDPRQDRSTTVGSQMNQPNRTPNLPGPTGTQTGQPGPGTDPGGFQQQQPGLGRGR